MMLLNAASHLLRYPRFKDAAKAIFNSAKDLMGVSAGYIAILNDDGSENHLMFLNEDCKECFGNITTPMPIRSLREWAFRSMKPVFKNEFDITEFIDFLPEGNVKIENVLVGPLVIEEKAVGFTVLANKPGGFSEYDCQRVIAFSELASVALRNSLILRKLEFSRSRIAKMNEKLNVVGRLSSHDVLNKVSLISNNLYLAKMKLPKDSMALDNLVEIERAIDKIENIFNFVKIYEKLGVEKLSRVDVGKCVNEAFMILGTGEIDLDNDCSGLLVVADSLLMQLFYNLMHNSLAHGENVSKIKVNSQSSEEGLLLIYDDDGIGIAEKEKERIFKEGYGKRTGYGLFLIRRICDGYGWTIKESGEYGKGARFEMKIPNSKFRFIS